jgi:hypothetical protein
MLTFDPIPHARVVRHRGRQATAPWAPRSTEPGPLRAHLRDALGLALGLWPLTAIVLLTAGLVIMAANSGAP